MTDATVATDVHETLDVELDFAAKVTLHLVIAADYFANLGCLIVAPVLNLDIHVNACLSKDCLGCAASDTKNIGQGDFTSFVLGEVNSHDSYCHIII